MARYLPEDWLVPQVDDRNRGYFTSGKILLQACAACGTVQHPPEEVCHRCQGTEFGTREIAPHGTIYSYTVVRHPTHPGLSNSIPYSVVLVSLDELPEVRITGNLLQLAPEKLRVGLPVKAVWEEVRDDAGQTLRLPQWVPAQEVRS
jgi:uncharacterized OB-fold protein